MDRPGEAKQNLTIGEAAVELGVSANWLRFAERLGSIPVARRNAKGWRVYSGEDLERLRRLGVGARKRRLFGAAS